MKKLVMLLILLLSIASPSFAVGTPISEGIIVPKATPVSFDNIVGRIEFKNDPVFFRNNVKTPEYRSSVKTDSDNNSSYVLNIFYKEADARRNPGNTEKKKRRRENIIKRLKPVK